MGECCQASKVITRNVVWWLNILFLIAGFGLIGCGVYFYIFPFAVWAGKDLAYVSGATGLVVLILSVLALCGASTQSNICAMWTYIVSLILLIIAQVSVVVVAMTSQSTTEDFLLDQWNNLTPLQRDELMTSADCGIHNPTWTGSSSCTVEGLECFADCYEIFSTEWMTMGSVFMIVGSIIVGLEVILVFCSFVVVCVDDSVGQKGQKSDTAYFRGHYATEKYCGGWSWLIGCTLFPCICCCPVDERKIAV